MGVGIKWNIVWWKDYMLTMLLKGKIWLFDLLVHFCGHDAMLDADLDL